MLLSDKQLSIYIRIHNNKEFTTLINIILAGTFTVFQDSLVVPYT